MDFGIRDTCFANIDRYTTVKQRSLRQRKSIINRTFGQEINKKLSLNKLN